jgi:hypothetical protein
MGMYTGLSFMGRVKEEMVEELKIVLEDANGNNWSNSNNKKFKDFGDEYSRSCMFPWGSLAYMPDSWDKYEGYSFEGGLFVFTCSLKNYTQEIDAFMNKIAPELCDEYSAIEHYEENEEDEMSYWTTGDTSGSWVKMEIEDFHQNQDIIDKLEKLGL